MLHGISLNFRLLIMHKKIGFGIIGYGSIGRYHLKAIMELEWAEVVAVSSRNPQKLENEPELKGITKYANYRDLIKDERVAAVSICTPSGLHLDPAVMAANAGKHLLIEKPLEVTLEKSRTIIDCANKNGVKLACIFQNRYSEDYLQLKKSVRGGALGKLILGNAYIKWFRDQSYYDNSDWKGVLSADGGAALINQSIHTIDLLLDVMGPVKSVRAKVATLTRKIEGEDLGLAILEFESGALGTIEGSTAIYAGFPEKLEVHGEKGSLILEQGELVHGLDGPVDKGDSANESGASDPMAIGYELHKRQIEEFVENIHHDTTPTVNGESSIKSVELINAIYESSRDNKVVYL